MRAKWIIISIIISVTLTACGAQWQKPVNLSDTERLALEKQITAARNTIESGAVFDTPEEDANVLLFKWIDIGLAYEQLGNLKKAAQTYEEAREIYDRSETLEVNLANVYREAGLTNKAIEQYLYVVETFQNDKYYNTVAWLYAKEKNDLKQAEQYVALWQKNGGGTDAELEKLLSELRQK